MAISGLFARHRANVGQFVRFGLVGGSGVLVNLVVAVAAKKLAPKVWPGLDWLPGCGDQPQECGVAVTVLCGVENTPLLGLFGTGFNIRWYHVFSILAFVVANLWNYELNRLWTFRAVVSVRRPGWWSALRRFFLVGLLAQLIGMGIETLLMNPDSPLHLPCSVFDGSTGWRTRWYWAHLAMILVTIPVSFLLNKFWSFGARRPKCQPQDEAS